MSPWYVVLFLLPKLMFNLLVKPGVADAEMEQLVNEKVDAFWKGIESGSNKRGRVSLTCLHS